MPAAPRRHKTDPPPLSAREIRFCQFWVETGNATRSYIEAGFPHASENAAAVGARKLLRKAQIRAYIRQLQTEAADAAKLSVTNIAQGIYRDANADRRRLFGPNGEMLPPSQWPDDVAATIQGIECEEIEQRDPQTGEMIRIGYKWKVKTTDRLRARITAAEWRGMTGTSKLDDAKTAAPQQLVIGGDANPDTV